MKNTRRFSGRPAKTQPVVGKETPPFAVRSAGFINRQPYHSTPGTRQGDIMLTVFLSGYGIYRNSAETRIIEKDFVGLVPPEDEGVLMADSADPYVHYYSRFNGEYAVRMAKEIVTLRGDRFFPVSNAGEIADCIRQMGSFISRELPARVGRREALLVQALTLLAEPQTAAEGRSLTVETIQEYLRERIAEPTDLEKMARHFFVSKTSLCRAAKKLCGETVQTMHERQKIEWARTLLKLGTLNVTEVSVRVGYEDPFYFSRVFSKLTGTSPRDWKKSGQGKSATSAPRRTGYLTARISKL